MCTATLCDGALQHWRKDALVRPDGSTVQLDTILDPKFRMRDGVQWRQEAVV